MGELLPTGYDGFIQALKRRVAVGRVKDPLTGNRFPEMRGLYLRNLRYIRAVAIACPDWKIVQQAVAELPWVHNLRVRTQLGWMSIAGASPYEARTDAPTGGSNE